MFLLQGLSSVTPDLVTSSWYNLALISDSASYSGSGAGSGYHMMLTGLETDAEYEVMMIIITTITTTIIIIITILGEAEGHEHSRLEPAQRALHLFHIE